MWRQSARTICRGEQSRHLAESLILTLFVPSLDQTLMAAFSVGKKCLVLGHYSVSPCARIPLRAKLWRRVAGLPGKVPRYLEGDGCTITVLLRRDHSIARVVARSDTVQPIRNFPQAQMCLGFVVNDGIGTAEILGSARAGRGTRTLEISHVMGDVSIPGPLTMPVSSRPILGRQPEKCEDEASVPQYDWIQLLTAEKNFRGALLSLVIKRLESLDFHGSVTKLNRI